MIQENDALNFSFNLDFSQKSIQYNSWPKDHVNFIQLKLYLKINLHVILKLTGSENVWVNNINWLIYVKIFLAVSKVQI